MFGHGIGATPTSSPAAQKSGSTIFQLNFSYNRPGSALAPDIRVTPNCQLSLGGAPRGANFTRRIDNKPAAGHGFVASNFGTQPYRQQGKIVGFFGPRVVGASFFGFAFRAIRSTTRERGKPGFPHEEAPRVSSPTLQGRLRRLADLAVLVAPDKARRQNPCGRYCQNLKWLHLPQNNAKLAETSPIDVILQKESIQICFGIP